MMPPGPAGAGKIGNRVASMCRRVTPPVAAVRGRQGRRLECAGEFSLGRTPDHVRARPPGRRVGRAPARPWPTTRPRARTSRLVTCTLGEEGEIHVPALAQLEAAQADQLGGYRITELDRACAALGVTDHRFLGGAGRYRDSGMMGTPGQRAPARVLAGRRRRGGRSCCFAVIDEVRPQVLVTYDENGFYGHPDHIQAHRVAMRAAEMATEAGFGPAKIYWTAVPLQRAGRRHGRVRRVRPTTRSGRQERRRPPVRHAGRRDRGPDRRARAARARRSAALRAHATQIPADVVAATRSPATSAPSSWAWSTTRSAVGEKGPGDGPNGWESDLFAGLD